ncbi:MAG: GNAT family N-acetyltransferase [Planctomycetes bacterium]|nr:GNAT family N-acetyltransferase [Planctomycetota bacterium]MCB9868385.1 GNAT family N-acetyltransferase [Planctomycetota bacterium]MCB9889622.1 GNAT family N-acetyltransferase [Planctomycetota bacterium]
MPTIRPITPRDDAAVATLVRASLASFGVSGPGSPATDVELDGMAAAYRGPAAQFFVIDRDGEVVGCGGFGPLQGTSPEHAIAEIRKVHIHPEIRGAGHGRALVTLLLERMQAAGYHTAYLETMPEMTTAQHLYRRLGFREHARLGSTGHSCCAIPFARSLSATADS